jgi:hypothetical protein
MTQQPEVLTIETVKAAARDFAMLVNNGALSIPIEVSQISPPHRSLRAAFMYYLAERFQFPLSLTSLDLALRIPHINVRILELVLPSEWVYIEYQHADQRIYGFESDLLIFAAQHRRLGYFDGHSDPARTSVAIERVLYVRQEQTGDREVTERINAILDEQPSDGTGRDELIGYIASFSPHLDRAERGLLADRILAQRPQVGTLLFQKPHWMVHVSMKRLAAGDMDLLDAAHALEGTARTIEQDEREQAEK